MFINLNVHSNYSLLMSSITIDDIINFAVKNKQKYVSLIDINSMYGTLEFYQKAIKNNLIPIIGLQITFQNEKVILIAKNNIGYKELVKISSYVMTEQEYDLTKFIDNLYVIVQDVKKSKWLKISSDTYSFDQNAFNSIAVKECFYESKEDVIYVKILNAIANNLTWDDVKNLEKFNDFEMLDSFSAKKIFSDESLKNLEKLITNCFWNIDFYKEKHLIKFDSKKSSKLLLQTLCREGLKKRLNSNLASVEYIERLTKELKIIDQMGFNDYFLVVQDYVAFAKNNGILVGPGRGSAAGSLVAYVLGITEIDPIQYGLIFERFLNPERKTMPDIDIDFMDDRRNEIIEYIYNKYSGNNVAHIITFQKLKSKMAIRDVCRVFGFDLKLVGMITKEFSNDFDTDINKEILNNKKIAEYSKKYPDIFKIATKLMNFPRQIGQHAAGIIVSDISLHEIVPIQKSTDYIFSTQFSMEYLELLGLIKMDILGLVNLSTINQCLKLIEQTKNTKLNLSKVPLDDKKVFDNLSSGNTVGIFQLESPGMRNLIFKIKPKSIEDISITSALFRPGPQKNIAKYLENKKNPENIKYLNEDFKTVLSSTYNIIIYQEQVIEIVCKVANFSLAEADLFRRAISKKDSSKLNSLREVFFKGGIKKSYSQQELENIFNYIFEFANYGFNHSHSIAYSLISYWMAYLKTHYQLQFFTVLLSSNDNSVDKISSYIAEAKKLGIQISPPSIQNSHYNFSIKKNNIIFGFNAIKGIGKETIQKIINVRNTLENKFFPNLFIAIGKLFTNSIGIKTIEILVKAGCFDEFLKKNQTRIYILKNLEEIYKASRMMKADGQFILSPNLVDDKPTDKDLEEIKFEQYKLLGVNFSEHPLIKIKEKLKIDEKLVPLAEAMNDFNNFSKSLIIVDSYREIKTKTGLPMAFVKIQDDSKILDAIIFPNIYMKYKIILKNNGIYLCVLKANDRGVQIISLELINYE